MSGRIIKVLVAKPGLDGHDRGAKIIAQAFRNAGMEVIYTGRRQNPEMIVNSAIQEDVDVVALSILSGAHRHLVPAILDGLLAHRADDIIVIVGGIIPDKDIEWLKGKGVAAVFTPGTPTAEPIEFVKKAVCDGNRQNA